MKRFNYFAAMLTIMVLTTACSNNDDYSEAFTPSKESESVTNTKTVLIYMSGRNDLSKDLEKDFYEIKEGSRRLGENNNLLVFVRLDNSKEPWLARIKNGEVTDSVSLSDMGIESIDGQNRASDPVVMEGVMHYAYNHYPATGNNYGLVIEGHGTGWLMMNKVQPRRSRAFGTDWGEKCESKDACWININTIADILKNMPHLKFIMADCCNMMCLENLYELRNACDYIIGSPAEIPDKGAPYDQIVPDLFADGAFYTSIIDKYYKSVGEKLPLTAVKTSEMQNVAQATRYALQAMKTTIGDSYADMTGIIHYYHTNDSKTFYPEYNIFYDAGDFIRNYAPADIYQQWRQALDKAIVECRIATIWATDKMWYLKYSDFTVTEEKMHGVSMFVPQDPSLGNYAKYNEDIKLMAWYDAIS